MVCLQDCHTFFQVVFGRRVIAAPVFIRRCERCHYQEFFLIGRSSNWLVNQGHQAANDTHVISVTPVVSSKNTVYAVCIIKLGLSVGVHIYQH